MQTLMINISDINGGASRAAYRLHKGLKAIGLNSKMLVLKKNGDDPDIYGPETSWQKAKVLLLLKLESIITKTFFTKGRYIWSGSLFKGILSNKIRSFNADIIHLHWIPGSLKINQIKKYRKPIIWTLHDSWAFTGGCHIPYDCIKYQNSCGCCPQLGSRWDRDLSRWVWYRKNKFFQNLNLTIVAPSRWMAECAKNSSIFKDTKVVVIPNGLDLKQFRPMNQLYAREILGFSKKKKFILFGAKNPVNDPQKGFNFLKPVFQELKQRQSTQEIEIVIFGANKPENSTAFGFPTQYMGTLHDEISLATLYSAVDVMILPSYQEAFGQTASEAMGCGTPVVAFDTTGLKDIVDHKKNGYLATPFDTNDFAHGIEFVLSAKAGMDEIRRLARKKVEEKFDIKKVVRMYQNLYDEVSLLEQLV
jgi:glycosyltransferase involved in cell wall biosynthesis